ncbi:hypothetical protein [Clostridioides difficile]|uniref:hypothetical protein n=1 Tax=Clostridioides difficile TaxID=1496 RepID=UPI002ED2C084
MFNELKTKENVYKNLINGKWVESNSRKPIEIYSPIDNSLVGKVQSMTKHEVDEVIKTQKRV